MTLTALRSWSTWVQWHVLKPRSYRPAWATQRPITGKEKSRVIPLDFFRYYHVLEVGLSSEPLPA
jgi:hypothetical protein